MEKKIVALADARRDADLAFLKRLVATDTSIADMGAKGNELAGQRLVMEELADLGAELDVFEPDYALLSRFREVNPGHDYRGRPNVVGVFKGTGGGRSLIINGHIDTVSLEADKPWISHPLSPEERGGLLYGRGTCDMKGGLAAALGALRALRECGARLRGDVIFESVVDEEGGGNGTLACCAKGYAAAAAVIPEPSGLALMPAHMGWLFYRLLFTGRAAHCAFKWKGVNAVEKCLKTVDMLQELEREWAVEQRHPYLPPPTVNIGRVDGGAGAAIVPDRCVLDFSVHYLPRRTADGEWMGDAVDAEVRRRLANFFGADDWLRDNPPSIELTQLGSAYDVGSDHAVMREFAACAELVTGGPPPVRGLESGADARLLVNYANTPTIIFGPGHIGNAHTVNEYLELDQFHAAVKILALAIWRWCGA